MNPKRFMETMAQFPSGVSVVTATDAQGNHHGLTLTALCSVSTEPPLVLVSLLENSNTLPAVRECGGFTVNFLSQNSEDVALLFASKQEDKFSGLPIARDFFGGPVLHANVCAYLVCRTVQEITIADHVLFVGRAENAAVLPGRAPLLYGRRKFSHWEDPVPALV